MRHLERYLARWAEPAAALPDPDPELRLAIIIPCLDEPDILPLIEQLGRQASQAVEIIVVVNHAEGAEGRIVQANRRSVTDLRRFAGRHPMLRLHVIEAFDLPAKDAGVGLARKIGMDEAMRRFASVGRPDGIIASLDADCRVSDNYIAGLIAAFDREPAMHAATLPFAHRLDEVQDARHRSAMVLYELFLRYVELGWRHAGLPYAFTSIGSCFAVRANACARHHGMNKRKAGEDFYFLHKLARERPLGYIPEACVYPSARMSSRTPFGTGQAVGDFYHGDESAWMVAAPGGFEDLKRMREALPQLFTLPTEAWLEPLPDGLSDFLERAGIASAVDGMRRHAASAQSFTARFFIWFDGLKAWRYVNQQTGQMPIEQAVAQLLAISGIRCDSTEPEALLMQMRQMERRSS